MWPKSRRWKPCSALAVGKFVEVVHPPTYAGCTKSIEMSKDVRCRSHFWLSTQCILPLREIKLSSRAPAQQSKPQSNPCPKKLPPHLTTLRSETVQSHMADPRPALFLDCHGGHASAARRSSLMAKRLETRT